MVHTQTHLTATLDALKKVKEEEAALAVFEAAAADEEFKSEDRFTVADEEPQSERQFAAANEELKCEIRFVSTPRQPIEDTKDTHDCTQDKLPVHTSRPPSPAPPDNHSPQTGVQQRLHTQTSDNTLTDVPPML